MVMTLNAPKLPESVEELLAFVPNKGNDRTGDYHIFTGFEGTGVCFWCGGDLPGRSIRWCRTDYGTDNAHWHLYYRHFAWSYARSWCFERYGYQCANCGYKTIAPAGDHPSWYTYKLEAHHIIPLKGEERAWSIFNLPWNLISLCHECHLEAAAAAKGQHRAQDYFELADKKGQGIFDIMRAK